MACSRAQKILNLLPVTSSSHGAATADGHNENRKGHNVAQIVTEGIEAVRKKGKPEDANNENYFERLMSLSSNLISPEELLPYESSTLSVSVYFDSCFEILQRNQDDLYCNQQKRPILAALNNVEISTESDDNILLSPETDPYATDHDSDDPDFVLSDQENWNNISALETEYATEDENEKNVRKRKRDLKSWKRNTIRSARNSGKEYVNWKDHLQIERKLKPPCQNCRNKCIEKISEEERKRIFSNFWALSDINRQRDFISKFVCAQEKQRCRKRPKPGGNIEEPTVQSRRTTTYTYFLSNEGKRTSVCKQFFLNTLSISGQMVFTVFSKLGSTGVVVEDRRGKASKNSILDESVKDSVRSHINAFETVESHYCRKTTQQKYLPATLNVSKMYALYLEHCQDNNITKVATEIIYRQIFNTEFNLSFFVPKKDLCGTCHLFEHLPDEKKSEMEDEYKQHLKNKELSRQLKSYDKDFAHGNPTFCSAVFDLQQVLSTPKSNVGLAYYKLKLSTYNFTIYNLSKRECQCFMWHKCIARRGASEIGSCLFKFIEDHVKKGVKEFSFFSDNCAGQNRNKYLFTLYSFLSQKYVIKIRHSFLEPGHTQSEGDSVHSVIERAAKNIPVYIPEQWYSIVRTAKRKAPFYTVCELSQNDVFDLKNLQSKIAINLDKDEDNGKVFTSKFKIVQLDPEFPNCLLFKTNYANDQFKKICLIKRGRRSLTNININDIRLLALYKEKIPLQKKKYDHLQFLCAKGVITDQYHDYFKELPFTSQQGVNEDYDSE